MVYLLTGPSHVGKTLLAQRLMERYRHPYLSLDLLKMGFIRSGQTTLTPEEDDRLREYLWPIVRELIKTAIENDQNLIVEGILIPLNWTEDFDERYLGKIRGCCLVMTPAYVERHFDDILRFANVVEHRLEDSGCTKESVLEDNARCLELCRRYGCPCLVIDKDYERTLEQAISLLEEAGC